MAPAESTGQTRSGILRVSKDGCRRHHKETALCFSGKQDEPSGDVVCLLVGTGHRCSSTSYLKGVPHFDYIWIQPSAHSLQYGT